MCGESCKGVIESIGSNDLVDKKLGKGYSLNSSPHFPHGESVKELHEILFHIVVNAAVAAEGAAAIGVSGHR